MAMMAAVFRARTRAAAIARIARIPGTVMYGQTVNSVNSIAIHVAATKATAPMRSRPCILSIRSSKVVEPACWLDVASIFPSMRLRDCGALLLILQKTICPRGILRNCDKLSRKSACCDAPLRHCTAKGGAYSSVGGGVKRRRGCYEPIWVPRFLSLANNATAMARLRTSSLS